MSSIILEIIRAVLIAIIMLSLIHGRRSKHIKVLKGWRFILLGFWLLFFGTVIDITDNFDSLSKYVIIGDTPTQVFLEKFVGFLMGYFFLALGILIWLPKVIKHEENMKKELMTSRKLIKDHTEELELVVECIASIAEHRDPETGNHIKRTQNYVKILAEELALNPKYSFLQNDNTIDILSNSARLHDIGKVGIPDRILLKPGKLTEGEFEIMKNHTILGKEALAAGAEKIKDNSFLKFAIDIALSHHEKWDGSGYPKGLKENQIPLSARLMALADVYDAIINKRVYKEASSHKNAVAAIKEESGKHFDPEVVNAFLENENLFKKIAKELANV